MSNSENMLLQSAGMISWQHDFLFSEAFVAFLDLIPEAAILSNEAGEIVLTNHSARHLFGYTEQAFKQIVIKALVPKAIRDVTQQKRDQERITEFAFVDALTNLPNRRYFDTYLDRSQAKAKRHGQGLALFFIDLDGFKAINDQLGHEFGDVVLQTISERLLKAVRDEDFVARIGGDEFAVVMSPLPQISDLQTMAHRMVDSCNKPIEAKGKTFQVSASVGINIIQSDVEIDACDVMSGADKAMYHAKNAGGNHFIFESNLPRGAH